jgi:hypothetical protein
MRVNSYFLLPRVTEEGYSIFHVDVDREKPGFEQQNQFRSIDHNIPARRVFEIVNYWQILLVNPPLPDFG